MAPRIKKINHLLLIRLSAMGDVAMTVPVVAGLRYAHPEMKITVLTRPFFKSFYRDIPDIEFLDFDPGQRHKGFFGLARLADDVRNARPDAIADLHNVLRTKVLRAMLIFNSIKVAAIDKGRIERKEMTRRTRKVLVPLIPMIERYRETILKLGIYFPIPHTDKRERRPMPEEIAILAEQKTGAWVGFSPFAKHQSKIYPIPLADELIGLLSKKYQRVFIFGGGDHEKSFAEGMEVRHHKAISVVGRVSLSQEMDVISNLDVIVTMDSAQMHIASLLGVPAVSVWGATHPFVGFYGFGQDPDNAVQIDMPCRPCSVYGNKPCIFGDYRCLNEIAPEMIVKTVAKVLKREGVYIPPAPKKPKAANNKKQGGKADKPTPGPTPGPKKKHGGKKPDAIQKSIQIPENGNPRENEIADMVRPDTHKKKPAAAKNAATGKQVKKGDKTPQQTTGKNTKKDVVDAEADDKSQAQAGGNKAAKGKTSGNKTAGKPSTNNTSGNKKTQQKRSQPKAGGTAVKASPKSGPVTGKSGSKAASDNTKPTAE